MKSIRDLEARATKNIAALIEDVDAHIKSLTPVWSGQAVRNYIWTVNTAYGGVLEAIDNGPTGPTNSMTLGTEPRRGINEDAAAQSLGSLNLGKPFQTFILTNNSPDIEGLEFGRFPTPPLKSRSPNGMFGLVNTFVNAKIAAKGILS